MPEETTDERHQCIIASPERPDGSFCFEKHHALRELLQSKFAALNEALILRTKELDRRLLELNHSHERSLEDKASFVAVQTFNDRANMIDREMREIKKDVNTAADKIMKIELVQNTKEETTKNIVTEGRLSILKWVALIGLIFTLVQILLTVVMYTIKFK